MRNPAADDDRMPDSADAADGADDGGTDKAAPPVVRTRSTAPPKHNIGNVR